VRCWATLNRPIPFAPIHQNPAVRFESDGKLYGYGGKKMGNPYLKWAFREVAVFAVEWSRPVEKLYDRLARKHGKGKARTGAQTGACRVLHAPSRPSIRSGTNPEPIVEETSSTSALARQKGLAWSGAESGASGYEDGTSGTLPPPPPSLPRRRRIGPVDVTADATATRNRHTFAEVGMRVVSQHMQDVLRMFTRSAASNLFQKGILASSETLSKAIT
jgi:hypothetical protein